MVDHAEYVAPPRRPEAVPAAAKPWGKTRCVHRDQTHEVWHAEIARGGFSSRHYHARKPNLFYVVSGTLQVQVFREVWETIPYETHTLEAGQRIVVDDHVWHRFEAVTDVTLVEVYWACLKGEDIVRADGGGRRSLP